MKVCFARFILLAIALSAKAQTDPFDESIQPAWIDELLAEKPYRLEIAHGEITMDEELLQQITTKDGQKLWRTDIDYHYEPTSEFLATAERIKIRTDGDDTGSFSYAFHLNDKEPISSPQGQLTMSYHIKPRGPDHFLLNLSFAHAIGEDRREITTKIAIALGEWITTDGLMREVHTDNKGGISTSKKLNWIFAIRVTERKKD